MKQLIAIDGSDRAPVDESTLSRDDRPIILKENIGASKIMALCTLLRERSEVRNSHTK